MPIFVDAHLGATYNGDTYEIGRFDTKIMTTEAHLKELELLKDSALESLENTASESELEQWRVLHIGRRGQLTKILRSLQTLSENERRAVGATANQIKKLLEDSLQRHSQHLKNANTGQSAETDRIDVTIPGAPLSLGRLHPTTQTIRQICRAFSTMGFQIMEGPEVEWDYYNFEALNIPQDHPARDMWDTLWLDWLNPKGDLTMLMRTHTSPMQARIMESQQPPIRVVVPGKCYRYEATDATHESQFHQVEGLAVDENLTFADLKGVLYEFARRIFGQERRARFRCDYFPFVEPGVEMAIDCFLCEGQGCRVCSGTGWIEIMGAGMVHPRVLQNAGYDPDRYTGFAFGIGAERVAMLKYGISDMRLFHANDLRFLKQF